MNTYNYSNLDYDIRIFLENIQKNSIPPCYTLCPKEARKLFSSLQLDIDNNKITKHPANVESHFIPNDINDSLGNKIPIYIYRPSHSTTSKSLLPVVMYFHGGGWTIGDIDTYDRLIRDLVNGTNVAVVFVNYSLSPEVKYPTALEEIYTATKWISENGKILGLNSSRLAVAGDSAGGNLAAALTLLAKERETPSIIFQVLLCPVTDSTNFETSSYIEYRDGYLLTREDMKWFWNNYLPNDTNRREPTISPLQATNEQLNGLPPALIIVAENDVLCDEGEAYAKKLMEAKVPTTAIRYIGTIHDFMALNVLADSPPSKEAINQVTTMLKKILSD